MITAEDSDLLLQRAWSVRRNAYAPYSNFAVGAALLTASGASFSGCNIEDISFEFTICAKRVAAAAAIQAAQREFVALAVMADTRLPMIPWDACRQFLSEFNRSLEINSGGRTVRKRHGPLLHLLPSSIDDILRAK